MEDIFDQCFLKLQRLAGRFLRCWCKSSKHRASHYSCRTRAPVQKHDVKLL